MGQFDVHRNGAGYLLDCQADVLNGLNTRLVVPLLAPDDGPAVIARLNPTLRVGGEVVVMYTQFAASVPARELGEAVGTLAHLDRTIINAFDMLLTGY